jgi:hypothetical protein
LHDNLKKFDTVSTFALISISDEDYNERLCFGINVYIYPKTVEHHTENNSEASGQQFNCPQPCLVSVFLTPAIIFIVLYLLVLLEYVC